MCAQTNQISQAPSINVCYPHYNSILPWGLTPDKCPDKTLDIHTPRKFKKETSGTHTNQQCFLILMIWNKNLEPIKERVNIHTFPLFCRTEETKGP